jgi:hypothetical protein
MHKEVPNLQKLLERVNGSFLTEHVDSPLDEYHTVGSVPHFVLVKDSVNINGVHSGGTVVGEVTGYKAGGGVEWIARGLLNQRE